METKGNKKKTLDEIIYDTYVEMQKRSKLFWYGRGDPNDEENFVPYTKEEMMELIHDEDSNFYTYYGKVPKEEFPLVCELWKLHDEKYKRYLESCNRRNKEVGEEVDFDEFCVELYGRSGLIDQVVGNPSPTKSEIKKTQRVFWEKYQIDYSAEMPVTICADSVRAYTEMLRSTGFVKHTLSAVWVILSFRENSDKKIIRAIDLWKYELWEGSPDSFYLEILEWAKNERREWREAEGIVEVDAEKDTKPKVQKSKKRSTKKSNDEEEEVKDINCMIELLEFCANTAKSWQKTIAELETENDRLRAENWELKYMKDEEKDGKVDDETVKQSLLSTLLVSQLDRASKFDIGDRKTIFRFLSSVATNDMEWLSRDILKEIDKLQFNKFDLNKIVEVFSQGGIHIGQFNIGNGTQGSQLPSPEDNK